MSFICNSKKEAIQDWPGETEHFNGLKIAAFSKDEDSKTPADLQKDDKKKNYSDKATQTDDALNGFDAVVLKDQASRCADESSVTSSLSSTSLSSLEDSKPNREICVLLAKLSTNEKDDDDYQSDEPISELSKVLVSWSGKSTIDAFVLLRKFEQFGKIVHVKVWNASMSGGLAGIIWYQSCQSAMKAAEEMNGKIVRSSLVTVTRF